MLEVLIPRGFAKTSTFLVQHLVDQDVDAIAHHTSKVFSPPRPVTARVCWGIPGHDDMPELNFKAGSFGKLQELRTFERRGIPHPQFWTRIPMERASYPLLARSDSHSEGNDLRVCRTPQEAEAHSASFYTKIIPSREEYRIWFYRDQMLGVYHRELCWPVKREGFGKNWWNGWGYVRLDPNEDRMPTAAIQHAKDAIRVMGLDFGAVDTLQGEDNRYYVLEVNTAPGVESLEQLALKKLATNIKEWYRGL